MIPDREIVLFVAGSPGYVEMAVDLVLSLREHNPEPVVLMLDDALHHALRPAYRPLFDRIVRLPPTEGLHYLGKLAVADAVEAPEMLYLDVDMLVLRSLETLWQECAGHDFVVQGDQLTREQPAWHHGHNTVRLMERYGLDSYLKSNAGWLYCKRDAGREIFADARELAKDGFFRRHAWKYGIVPSEPLLGIVGGRRGLTARGHPLVMNWDLDGVEPNDSRYPILHLTSPPSDDLETWWREGVERRRRDAGVPGAESCWQPWAAKIARLKRSRKRAQRLNSIRRWLGLRS